VTRWTRAVLRSAGFLRAMSLMGQKHRFDVNRSHRVYPDQRTFREKSACRLGANNGSDKPYVAIWEHETGQP
jgi:hypothetical protein